MSKRKGWDYSLQIKGVVGKDRKPKTYYFVLLETEDKDPPQEEALRQLVAQKLLETKYKFGMLAIIKYPIVIQEHVHHSNKANRSKMVEVHKGEVVWRSVGYNPAEAQKVKKEVKKAA